MPTHTHEHNLATSKLNESLIESQEKTYNPIAMIMNDEQSSPDTASSFLRSEPASSTAACHIPTTDSTSTIWASEKQIEQASAEPTTAASVTPPERHAPSVSVTSNDVSSDDQSETDHHDHSKAVTMTVDELVEDRRAKNRLSAHQSRLRKRRELKYLQSQVMDLTDKHKKLKDTNDSTIHELAAVRAENAQLRMMTQQRDAMRLAAVLQAQGGGFGNGGGMLNPFGGQF